MTRSSTVMRYDPPLDLVLCNSTAHSVSAKAGLGTAYAHEERAARLEGSRDTCTVLATRGGVRYDHYLEGIPATHRKACGERHGTHALARGAQAEKHAVYG